MGPQSNFRGKKTCYIELRVFRRRVGKFLNKIFYYLPPPSQNQRSRAMRSKMDYACIVGWLAEDGTLDLTHGEPRALTPIP